MTELRWTLLVLGVLFIAVLAWWELRRPRQARRGDHDRRMSIRGEAEVEPPRVHREPAFSMPDMRAREPVHDLPVIEVSDDSMIGLRIDGRRVEEEIEAAEAAETPSTEASIVPSEPGRDAPAGQPSAIEALDESEEADGREEDEAVETVGPSRPVTPESLARVLPVDLPPPMQPIVDWPPEDERQILALRLVAPIDRFPGRAVRQALAAEGFVLGKFSIFHKAGPDGRALISAASLTRPGTFDLDTIDTRRFGGLNLFTVLPGPLPVRAAFDELLATARNLNERLQGGLQDDRGQPLTPARVVALRESLEAGPPAVHTTGPPA